MLKVTRSWSHDGRYRLSLDAVVYLAWHRSEGGSEVWDVQDNLLMHRKTYNARVSKDALDKQLISYGWYLL